MIRWLPMFVYFVYLPIASSGTVCRLQPPCKIEDKEGKGKYKTWLCDKSDVLERHHLYKNNDLLHNCKWTTIAITLFDGDQKDQAYTIMSLVSGNVRENPSDRLATPIMYRGLRPLAGPHHRTSRLWLTNTSQLEKVMET
jgi:hypothetical protein